MPTLTPEINQPGLYPPTQPGKWMAPLQIDDRTFTSQQDDRHVPCSRSEEPEGLGPIGRIGRLGPLGAGAPPVESLDAPGVRVIPASPSAGRPSWAASAMQTPWIPPKGQDPWRVAAGRSVSAIRGRRIIQLGQGLPYRTHFTRIIWRT